MAARGGLLRFCDFLSINNVFTQPIRGSMYTAKFVSPIVNKEVQEEVLNSEMKQELKYRPIKAALADTSTSIFYDETLQKFINMLLRKGNKALATDLVERALYSVKRTQFQKYYSSSSSGDTETIIDRDPLSIFHKAIYNATPALEMTPIKRGGITYQVPVPITAKRGRFLAMRWFIEASASKSFGGDKPREVRFYDQLAKELIDASNNQGRVIKRKQELHRKAEANKAYAHYRWS